MQFSIVAAHAPSKHQVIGYWLIPAISARPVGEWRIIAAAPAFQYLLRLVELGNFEDVHARGQAQVRGSIRMSQSFAMFLPSTAIVREGTPPALPCEQPAG